ncbi:putative pre-mRNA-splicing factor ATP-dependent RNA helicase DHX16 isoform X4 [Battus philenor]|uniref:putative pre-mRNA-splicing factor ATP-dependent RNA helicase DHX16 isoform X4 n=1 Tax=Battus philenor TaxID=42288 RepID=UPI0035CFCE13
MEEDHNDTCSRFRSPVYSKDEVNALIDIIEKYKNVILNKSTTASANHAKDAAWISIAKEFNIQGFKHTRSADSLKIKWDNIKREARKLTKNLINVQYNTNDLCGRVVDILLENEKCENASDKVNLERELDEINKKDRCNMLVIDLNSCEDEESDESDGDMDSGRSNRSLNFSPQECSLLMKCVREEKKDVFIKETTSKANLLKSRAWAREIKTEPVIDNKFDIDVTEEKVNCEDLDDYIDSNKNNNFNEDPLDTVINGDSAIGYHSQFSAWCLSDSKDVEKLKLQLLNYQMETAKMERKRVEDAMKAEAAVFESNALERALRIRAARLEAVAAEEKLPSNHPALQYTHEEKPAQQYLESHKRTS